MCQQQQQNMQQQQQNMMPQASPQHCQNTVMTVPSPAHSVSSNQGHNNPQGPHAPSLPSQSPHSQHNMTSPHPQPSPHQTSPHPMTISPAAHSPYQPPQPQPSPQPQSVVPQAQARQPARSPHVQQQHQQHHNHSQQMHHFQQMSRIYAGQYPNYAAAAAMTAQHAPHHLGRNSFADMAASMFPPNPMFNLPTHHHHSANLPTTPPKQSSKSSKNSAAINQASACPTYGMTPSPVVTAAAAQAVATAAAAQAVASSSNHKTSYTTSLSKLQQLTNGLENQAKPSRPNSALLAPGYYPQQTSAAAQSAQATAAAAAAGGIHPPGHPTPPSGQHATHDQQARMLQHASQYSQNHMQGLYTGYPGYLNPYAVQTMSHYAAVTDHHQRTAASHHPGHSHPGVSTPNPPPHHHQMYPGYPALPYNYHR